MNTNSIEQVVKDIAERTFEVDRAVVTGESRIREDLGASSLTRLEFLIALERHFDIQLDLEEMSSAATLDEVVGQLSRQVERA